MKLLRILAAMLPLCALTACNDVDEQARYEGPIAVEAKKNVLLEDFTGQKCSNCPKGHEVVEQMKQQYGTDRVIAVSMHGGSLSLNDTPTSGAGLAGDEGNQYHTAFGITTWPKGKIDRGTPVDVEEWNTKVIEAFGVEPKADVEVTATHFDADTRTLTVSAKVAARRDVQGKLQLWLTESGIVALQFNGPAIDRNYVHNHVFRAAINGLWGDEITLAEGAEEERTYTYTLLRPYWNAANLSVVAFYYNDADGVMQVVEQAVPAAE